MGKPRRKPLAVDELTRDDWCALYMACEWVTKVLARLTPKQRELYEKECRSAPRHRTRKLYDGARAEIAERILYEAAMKPATSEPGE